MIRLSSLLLALLLAVTPTVDVVCRAVCTPNPSAAAVPTCHEVASDTAEWLPGVTCQRDALAAVVSTDGARNIVAPAPLVTALVIGSVLVPASRRADLRRQTPRPPSHGHASATLLRI
jgi:hypothetical protein